MHPERPIRLVREEYAAEPTVDTAVSRALLLRASDGHVAETFRIHVPGRIVAFGKRDALEPGYPAAVAAAADAGFASVERLAGGRAAVFTEHTLAFSWTVPDPDPRSGIYERFAALAGLMVGAFRRLGVESTIGEIPGEYCPGEYSVHHRGRIKLMGVGQRLARHAAHVGGVIVVDQGELIRDVLVPVYSALGLEWNPSTAGALSDVVPEVTLDAVAAALVAELATQARLTEETIDEPTLALAHALAPDHRPSVAAAS